MKHITTARWLKHWWMFGLLSVVLLSLTVGCVGGSTWGGKKYEAEEREEERRRKRIRSVPNDIRILKNELLHEKAVKKSTLYEYGNFWRSPDEKKKLRQKLDQLDKKIAELQRNIDYRENTTQQSCFPAETLVLMADGSYKKISGISVGDALTTYDIATERIEQSYVKQVFTDENNHYFSLNEKIYATGHERFLTRNGWQKIRDLRIGDEVFNGNTYEPVVNLEKKEVELEVYNLNIEKSHNFFVSLDGMAPFLVHNSSGGDGGGK